MITEYSATTVIPAGKRFWVDASENLIIKIRRLKSGNRDQPSAFERGLLRVWFFLFLDRHVLQFTGLENVPTFLAFHIFGFFVAGDDLHPRMLALFGTDFFLWGMRRLAMRHKLVDYSTLERKWAVSPNFRYFAAVG